jgi:hypothetical protein
MTQSKHMLNTLLRNVFSELGFTVDGFSFVKNEDKILENSILAKDSFRKSYYLILFVEDNDDLATILNLENEYFYLMKEFVTGEPEIDKNTSMVVCLKTDVVPENLILRLEEDLYYFKKYVFTYRETQPIDFFTVYKHSIEEIGYKKTLDKILHNKELFQQFKTNPENNDLYDFVSRLFIKIPALNIEMIETDGAAIEGLSKYIDKRLQNRNLYELKQRLLITDLNVDDIEQVFQFIDMYVEGND